MTTNQNSVISVEAQNLVNDYLSIEERKMTVHAARKWALDLDTPSRIFNEFILALEFFFEDVKFRSHPRYGKNASWGNYKHPDTKAGEIGPKTYWYMYETAYTNYDVKFALSEAFGPKVYESVPAEQTFEQAVFNYWMK